MDVQGFEEDNQSAAASNRRTLVVVLGMHRSGSSAIARGLEALGVGLGDNLMPPADGNNEKGFFEDLDIYELNERLLERAGSAWHRLTPLEAQAFAGPSYSRERREAAQLLADKLSSNETFAFKDPRTAVLLPFWRCVFEDLDLETHYLITVRNPIETAASLEKRDGFPLEKGVLLWAKHMLEAVRATQQEQRLFVSFDRVLSNPVAELQRVANGLGLPPPDQDGDAVREYCDEFLDPALRHSLVGDKELRRSGLASPFVIELYDAVNERAAQPAGEHEADPIDLSAVETGFDAVAPVLGFADLIDGRRGEDLARLKDAQRALEKARQEKKATEEARAQSDAALTDVRNQLEALKRSNAAEIGILAEARDAAERNADALRIQLAEAAEKAEQESSALRNQLAEAAEKAEQESSALRDRFAEATEKAEREANALQKRLTEASEQAKRESDAWRDRFAEANERAEREFAAWRDQLAEATEKLEEAQARETRMRRQFTEEFASARERADRRVVALKATVSERESELAASRDEAAKWLHQSREMEQKLRSSQARVKSQADALQELRRERKAQNRDLLLLRADAKAIRHSTSWRLTAPVRAVGLLIRSPGEGVRRIGGAAARRAWRLLPMPARARGKLAGALFRVAPFLFGWSSAYKAWREAREGPGFPPPPGGDADAFAPAADPEIDYGAPLVATTPLLRPRARALAFCLPQFHPIAENKA